MITLAITGSMGAGKSTIATMLRELLIPVFDADAAVHSFMAANGQAVASISHYFPDAVKRDAHGAPYIDRKILGRALADDENMQTLEDILHPLVYQAAAEFKQDMAKQGEMLIGFDIPLLFETSTEDIFDVVLCVSASEDVRRERILARPGMTLERWRQIVARQMPDAEKRQRAHLVLETHGGLAETRQRLQMMLADIRAKTVSAKL